MTESVELSPARHVPRIALDWLAETPDDIWRRVEGTMVFADISGFTALSERLATRGRIGAEELVETLSRVFGAMLDTAADRGGQLLKFGGDALLFLFAGSDHVRQAASTAVEMRAELRRASDIVTSVGRLSLSVSIGVHSGEFDLFLVGAPHRELVVLGPGTTGVVSAENAAEAGQIVVSSATAALLPSGSVRPRDDGELLLKWRKAPVEPAGRLPALDSDREASQRLLPAILAASFDDTRPDPAHRVATVSFMRFSGTDAILAEQGPLELARRLHETLEIAQSAFVAEDIALLCVDCDVDAGKIFCSAGVPLTSEDDEGRMLRAARAIQAAEPPLPLQIGINRGHVFVAEIGTPHRAAYSAMGDTTNTAARICGKSQRGAIYVHPDVLEHSRVQYESEPVGPFTFKGKAQPQVLYEVGEELGLRTESADDDGPFIERVGFLEPAIELIESARSGRGGAITVTGEVGVGKTRLINEALRAADNIARIALHAEPYGMTNPYRVFRDPVRQLLGIERGSHIEMARQLRAAIERAAPDLLPWAALVGDVVQVEVDPSPDVLALLPRFRPDRTADVVLELLDHLLVDPVVVTIEDAHWADDPSAHLADRLARHARSRPWAIVVARRPESGGVELSQGSTVELPPFADDQLRAFVNSLTEGSPLRPHEVQLIVDRSGGNPLFAKELIAVLRAVGEPDAVPHSLQGALAAQVDALDPLAKRVMSYASVLGRSFRRYVLDTVLAREEVVVDDATMDRLGQFLEADGDERWRFRNGLVRDVTYDGLGYRLRAKLHLETGETIEQLSTDLGAEADILALHFSEAGDHRRAYEYANIAAERSERSFANVNAARQLDRALQAARRLDDVDDEVLAGLWYRLGEVRDGAGLLDEALDAFRQAARLTADPVRRGEIVLRRARVRERSGAFSTALRETTRVRRQLDGVADVGADEVAARAAAFAALIRQRQERVSDAATLAEAAVEAAEAAGGNRAALARAYSVLSWVRLVRGEDPMDVAHRALKLFEDIGDLVGESQMASNLGGYCYFQGDWEATLDWYERGAAASQRLGNVTDAALTSANSCEVLVNQGRLDEAEPILRESSRVLRSSGHLWGATFADMHLARLLTARGRVDEAEPLFRRCIAENAEMGSTGWVFEATIHFAECLVVAGRPGEALDELRSAADQVDEDVSILSSTAAIVEARALHDLGRVADAQVALTRAVDDARRRHLEFDLARGLELVSRWRFPTDGLGTDDAAVEANTIFERLGVVSLADA